MVCHSERTKRAVLTWSLETKEVSALPPSEFGIEGASYRESDFDVSLGGGGKCYLTYSLRRICCNDVKKRRCVLLRRAE